MTRIIEGLRDSAQDAFAEARQVLLPKEEIHLVCETQKGFLVVSNRRLALLNENTELGYRISKAIPYTDASELTQKKPGRFEVSGSEIAEPRRISGESKDEAREYFQSTINLAIELVEEMKQSDIVAKELASRDISYLEDIPKSLTRNAILDLNAVIDDRPVHNELVTLALKFLGSTPFLIEDSLRDANDSENGVLFAAGDQGYYWVRGKKKGRLLSNVIVDTIEWNNIQFIAYRWSTEIPTISVSYSLVQGGKPISMEYQWLPPINDDTLLCPWIIQPYNGPYIFEDILHKHSRRTAAWK